jgi:hypothetical protein
MREPVETDRYEYRVTRDLRIPLVDGDKDFSFGSQNLPLPASPDDRWEVWEVTRDKKTVWRRPRQGPAIWLGEPQPDDDNG